MASQLIFIKKKLAHNQEGSSHNDSICSKIRKNWGQHKFAFLALIPKEVNPSSFSKIQTYIIVQCVL
jgi:hypothetical protein